nr:IS256 family transposase [Oligoflexus tunisiensis]
MIEFPRESEGPLLTVLREGARKILAQAIEVEVDEYIRRHAEQLDETGKRLVVRNGFMPERTIQTGLGDIPIKAPRVNDRRSDESGKRLRFHSKLLPPYLRRTKAIEELIPWLYLMGVSTGDFSDALTSLVGKDAPGLSASTVTRLKSVWQDEYRQWRESPLGKRRFVYIWADGIYFNIRLGEDLRMCMLVIVGADSEGNKEILAVEPGYRESATSWKEILLRLRDRGLTPAPELAIADGALGFWAALAEVMPEVKGQRCWVHKTASVLDKLPKSRQPEAKGMLHEIYEAETRESAEKAFKRFMEVFEAKHPRAAECLVKDNDKLLAFYDFPAEHWRHIRTTNPIESSFATVRLRTKRTKGCGSVDATVAMTFKLLMDAKKGWRKLNGHKLLADVIDITVKFKDGIKMAA